MARNRCSPMVFEPRAAIALALFLLPFSALARQAQAPAAPSATYQEIDALAAAELAKDNVAGATVGIVSGGSLAWTKSYGYADTENKILAAKETVYRIGSITKQFTALMLLQLVQDGKVHFSDPVEKYFPDVNKVTDRFPGAPPITLIQLATHTSGLAREPSDLETYLKGSVSDWEKVLIAALPHTKYEFEPGTRFSYSNIGYAILGAALGRAEMGGGPAGVLSKESLEQHYKRIISSDANLKSGYGAGFEIFRRGDLIGIGHSGAVAGYEASAYFDRNTSTGVIILRNALGGLFNDGRLAVEILTKMTSKDVAAQPEARPEPASGTAKSDAPPYAAYAGQYELPGLGVLTITSEGNKLFGQPGEAAKEELVPQSENQFSVPGVGAQISFVKDASGNVTSIVVKHGNQEIQGKKIK